MKITKKIDSKTAKMRHSVENMLTNPKSPLFCDKCEKKLGIGRMLRSSIFTRKGGIYIVICKNCKTKNYRKKGAIGQGIDENWKKYGFE